MQSRLARLICEPSGVEEALAGDGDAAGSALGALVRGDCGVSALARLSVYSNAYFARLHDALREDYPALARVLGAGAFHDLVKTYLMMEPPTRPSIRHAGARLVAHLETEPFAEIFARVCPFAPDLARLEWALVEAFFAADSVVLRREDLAELAPEEWPELQFAPSPALRLLSLSWPVQRVWREESDPPVIERAPTHLRVFRVGEQAQCREISAVELRALRALAAGETFGTVCEKLEPATAAGFVAGWLADGLLVR